MRRAIGIPGELVNTLACLYAVKTTGTLKKAAQMVEEQHNDRCPACGIELDGDLATRELGQVFTCPRTTCQLQLEQGDGEILIHTFEMNHGYALCVLPFVVPDYRDFDVDRSLDHSSRWIRQSFSLDNPQDVERTEYFLPYVRRFLFPSLFSDGQPNGDALAEPTCRHYEFDLARLAPVGDDGSLPIEIRCHDRGRRTDFCYDVRMARVSLVLFSFGVGFLILKFTPGQRRTSYFDQMNALGYLRAMAPLYTGFRMPKIATESATFVVPQLLAFLLNEFGRTKLPQFLEELPKELSLPVKPAYDDRMMVYTFSCLDRETCLEEMDVNQRLLAGTTVVNFDAHVTSLPKNQTQDRTLRTWQHQRWQGFSKDGGSLVVFDTDRFHERFIGQYTETYYFDIFLLATLQRVTLLHLFERLSDIQGLTRGDRRSRKLLRRVRKDLLVFKNQCWFSQITNHERGLQLWKRWQEQFENRMLLEEVNDQSEQLDNYLQGVMRERFEWLVRLGGFLAAAVPAVLGIEVLFGEANWVHTAKWVLFLILIIGSGIFAWFTLLRQRDDD